MAFARALRQRALLHEEEKQDQAAFPLLQEAMQVCEQQVFADQAAPDAHHLSAFLDFAVTAVQCAHRLGRSEEAFRIADLAYRLGKDCPDREGIQSLASTLGTCGSIHKKAGRNAEAIAAYRRGLEVSKLKFEGATWHWWLRQNVGGAYLHLGELYQRLGDIPAEVRARQEFLRVWGKPILGMKAQGYIDPDPPPSEAEAQRLRALMAKLPGMKRFTIPCDFNGLKYPFHVYVTDVPWPKDPLEDQARWLEEVRGGTIPKEVRESFRKLHKIAHDNKVSFQDLCLYALGAAAAKEGKKLKIEKLGD
jgi:tetratricopeptide (TPR) repeat protein